MVSKTDAEADTPASAEAINRVEASLLPVSIGAEKVDGELIDGAITHIRMLLAKTVVRGMEEIGR